MKKTLSILGLLITLVNYSQTYEISYAEVISLNDENLDDLKELLNEKMKDNKKSSISLKYSNGISSYVYKENEEEFEDTNELNTYNNVVFSNIYKNQKKGKLSYFYKNFEPTFYGEDILVNDNLDKIDWKISKEIDDISGYKCVLAKATLDSGKKLIAWFTDQIPINEGPRQYWGLPGLIIQLQINEQVLIAATSVKRKDENSDIIVPSSKNSMTQTEFADFQKDLYKPRTITLPDGREVQFVDPADYEH